MNEQQYRRQLKEMEVYKLLESFVQEFAKSVKVPKGYGKRVIRPMVTTFLDQLEAIDNANFQSNSPEESPF